MKLEWAATVAAALVLAGCSTAMATGDARSLDGTAWVLSSLPGGAALAGVTPTARFDSGRMAGTDGCNRYSVAFRTAGASIAIGPRGISTQMACPPDQMKQAEAFMAALSAAKSYRASDERLQLLGADGAVLASFAAQAQALAGTAWHATAINNGREAVVSLVTGTTVLMEFAGDGRVSGSAGCNRYTATWRAEGKRLGFTPAVSTRMACAAPGVMEQEQAFLNALATVATMQFEGDRLELRTAQDALALMLTRVK
jgi:heat shock protein HslJ